MSEKHYRLKNFTVSFLAIALGLAGFTFALQKAGELFKINFYFSIFLILSEFIFLLISVIYIIKIIKYPGEFKKEINHPIKINFYPIIAKVFLIFSIIYLSIDMVTSKYLWMIGTAFQFFFSIVILSVWIRHSKFEIHHLNPAWFIPIVGNVMVPIAGIQHGFVELSWFFFSIGIVMWLTLFIIIFNRIIFHHPIADKLIPTLFILFAPPAIAFISYTKLIGEVDPFGRVLYYISLFLFMLIIAQMKMFSKIKFYLSWWAYSFPIVALTVATNLMYHKTLDKIFYYLSGGLLILLIFVVSLLTLKTIIAIKNKSLCIEEDD